jgi:chorismate lyase
MSQQWQSYQSLKIMPPPPLVPWLRDPTSFMQRLRDHQVLQPQVQVLSQQWQYPTVEEAKLLSIPSRQYALAREVLITSGEGKWMFARTIIPRQTLTGREQLLARLKNRALGTLLFNNPGIVRQPFEFATLAFGTSLHKKISYHANFEVPVLWARRSIFQIKHKQLLLMEVLFPDLMEL